MVVRECLLEGGSGKLFFVKSFRLMWVSENLAEKKVPLLNVL